jgi:hypothetical protein
MKKLIITVGGLLRNEKLAELPDSQNIIGVDGRQDIFEVPDRINQGNNKIILGSELSRTQAAAVLSHNMAQTSLSEEWVCILEDDAIILDPEMFEEGLNDIQRLILKKPTIFLLYCGFGAVVSKSVKIGRHFSACKVKSLPTGAVGYALNSSARKVISSIETITGTPDWPTWAGEISFYTITPNTVSHDPEILSLYTMGTSEDFPEHWPHHRRKIGLSARSIFNKKITHAYGGLLPYLNYIIFPAINRAYSAAVSRMYFKKF